MLYTHTLSEPQNTYFEYLFVSENVYIISHQHNSLENAQIEQKAKLSTHSRNPRYHSNDRQARAISATGVALS